MSAADQARSSEPTQPSARLAEAEETLRAIYQGEVDALVVAGPQGDQVFTLKGAETAYRLLVESMNEGALTLASDGTILYCNNRFAEFAGKPLREVAGANWRHFLASYEHPRFERLLKRAKWGGKAEFTLATGEGLAVEISVRSLKLDDIDAYSVLVTNIADRKRSEQALQRAREELELRVQERTTDLHKANESLQIAQVKLMEQARDLERQIAERTAHLNATIQSLETLCYNMAHDLRAPNRAMQGFAELLLADYSHVLDDTGRDYLRRITAGAARNDSLILDMLAYGRLGHAPIPCAPHCIESSVRAALNRLDDTIKSKNARMEVKGPFPEALANPPALEQALTNLVSNALKFVAEGVCPEVQVWSEQTAQTVRILIKDNGIGVPNEGRDKLFKVFERLAPTRLYPGTGIGLAIVQKAAERMGGRVGFHSQPGKGSCFWIELPSVSCNRDSKR